MDSCGHMVVTVELIIMLTNTPVSVDAMKQVVAGAGQSLCMRILYPWLSTLD